MTRARAHRDPTALLDGVSEQHSQNPSHRRNGRGERTASTRRGGHVVPERTDPHRLRGWLAQGKLRYRETMRDGLDNTLDAFLATMQGENFGKMIVKL
jgi:hypothetical protein